MQNEGKLFNTTKYVLNNVIFQSKYTAKLAVVKSYLYQERF